MKSKEGGQDLCRNAVEHIKNFYNDDPGYKTFFSGHKTFEARKMFCSLGHHYQNFKCDQQQSCTGLGRPLLIAHLFHHSLFQVLAATFTARVFLVGILFTQFLNASPHATSTFITEALHLSTCTTIKMTLTVKLMTYV